MNKLLVLVSLGVLAWCGWRVHQWSTARKQQHSQWTMHLAALHTARMELAAGRLTAPTVPAECVPPTILRLLLRRGTPLDGVLAAAEDTLRTRLHAYAHQRSALAGVRATALIMAALPLMGMVLGVLLGAHPLHFLTHGWGSAVLLAGTLLQAAGLGWIRRMAERLPPPLDESLTALPLLAALLRAGMHVEDAYAHLPPTPPCCHNLLRFSARHGAPIAAQLEVLARDQQRQALAQHEEATEEMGVLLARPLGACFLPAFMLLGVLPIVIELGGSYLHF